MKEEEGALIQRVIQASTVVLLADGHMTRMVFTSSKNSTTSEYPYCDARCNAVSSESLWWLTLAREGPCCTRMFTISMLPFQAARCSGQLPELSGIIVEAPHFSRRDTASLGLGRRGGKRGEGGGEEGRGGGRRGEEGGRGRRRGGRRGGRGERGGWRGRKGRRGGGRGREEKRRRGGRRRGGEEGGGRGGEEGGGGEGQE